MKRLELIRILSSLNEEEVYIEIDDFLCDFDVSITEEIFDGFDTVYPASIVLKTK